MLLPFLFISCKSAALSSATQDTTPTEFDGKWRTCPNENEVSYHWVPRFPMPTLSCARYGVKLKKTF